MRILLIALLPLLAPLSVVAQRDVALRQTADPLVIGETFTIHSSVLGEVRRINVYAPAGYTDSEARLPVLYMPDGGIREDFLHVAGLIQISSLNGTMRPFLLVGIENTHRRRDLTGPTRSDEDRAIAPVVGGSAAFRQFIRTELMPEIRARYRISDERAIVGESLAGLFVVETFFVEPELFDTYIAFDPSLWWDDGALVAGAGERLAARGRSGLHRTLYLANSGQPDIADLTRRLARILDDADAGDVDWFHDELPAETHGTIYHPAALRAFRTVLQPAPDGET